MTLRQLRIVKGVSGVEVATACGMTKQTYWQIERKGICSTTEEKARKIAAFFGVGLFEIAGVGVLKFKPRDEAEWDDVLKSISERAGH